MSKYLYLFLFLSTFVGASKPALISNYKSAAIPTATLTTVQAQCGNWADQYTIVPMYSWGSAPGAIQNSWQANNCNNQMCRYWFVEYGVTPYVTWGSLPSIFHNSWTVLNCNVLALVSPPSPLPLVKPASWDFHPVNSSIYSILTSNYCLSASTAANAPVVTSNTCNTTLQQWTYFPWSGLIQNQGTGTCLIAQSGNYFAGAPVVAGNCARGPWIGWTSDGTGRVFNIQYPQYCLAVSGNSTSPGTILVISLCSTSQPGSQFYVTSNSPPQPLTQPFQFNAGTSDLAALSISGLSIVNSTGKAVKLRGINLSSWLVYEPWITSFTNVGSTAYRSTVWYWLQGQIGITAAQQVQAAYEDNWITTHDLDLIKGWGLNLIRLPFSWLTLQYYNATTFRTNPSGYIDFTRLDWLVNEAAARGIYVLPTLVDWYTIDVDYSLISKNDPSLSAAVLAEAQTVRDLTCILWSRITEHYKGVNTIMGFDIINEPTGSYGNVLWMQLYNSVRATDTERIIVMNWGPTDNATASRWYNTVYEDHLYIFDNATEYGQIDSLISLATGLANVNTMPRFVGEFQCYSNACTAYIEYLESQDIFWTKELYKTVWQADWGFVNYEPHGPHPNMSASPASLITAFQDYTQWSSGVVAPGAVVYPLIWSTYQIGNITAAF